jgi:hypothetical protein
MKHQKYFLKVVAVIVALTMGTSFAYGAPYSDIPKKLIEAGWDAPDTARLRANLEQMEKTPFDGVVLHVTGKNDAGKIIQAIDTFSNIPWKEEWFKDSIDDLKVIHSKKLTDNFIQTGANPGNVDWFDDDGWKQVIDHIRIVAQIAREGHLKGILFDPETYTNSNRQFAYLSQPQHDKHSFEEYETKARERGKEFISAVAAVDPNLVFLTFFMNSVNAPVLIAPDKEMALRESRKYNLYPAFINGWLDAAPSSIIFVDGCEDQGYAANDQLAFLQTANQVRNTAQNLVAPENRLKYLAQVQLSFGLYLDAYVNPPGSPWRIDPKGVSPTRRLQINTGYAAGAANEYVWLYGEKYRWWPTPKSNVNPESWEDKLPGITDALMTVTHPEDLQAKIARIISSQGKLNNLLENGNFVPTKQEAPAGNTVPGDWKKVDALPGWYLWQTSYSHGTFSLDDTISHGDDQSGSARLAGVIYGSLSRAIDVNPGETYIVQAWTRQQGNGSCWVRVGWMTKESKWTDEALAVQLYGDKDADKANWHKIQGVVTVPEGAGKLNVILCASNQSTPQDMAWYDDISVIKMP